MSQTEYQGHQIVLEQALSIIRKAVRSDLNSILPGFDLNLDLPLRMYASNPADAFLHIQAQKIQLSDGSSKSVPPISGAVPSVVASTIDFQNQATTGATFSISFPSSTVGQYRRAGLSLTTLGVINVSFSAESGTVGGLADPGTLMAANATPIGYIDLECTHSSGKFKTVGSSTSVIENSVGGTSRIVNFTGTRIAAASSITNTYSITAGENLSARQPVYISLGAGDGGRTAGRAYKLDATNSQRAVFAGFATAAATAGNPATIQYLGELLGFSGLTVGQQQYGSITTPGDLQTTAPTVSGQFIVEVGLAISATSVIVNAALAATNLAVLILSSTTPTVVAITGSAGSSDEVSNAGHVHGQATEYDAGTATASTTIDFANGASQKLLVDNVGVCHIHLTGGVVGNVYKLITSYGKYGGEDLVFDSSVHWPNDTYPGNTADPYTSDAFYFYLTDTGLYLAISELDYNNMLNFNVQDVLTNYSVSSVDAYGDTSAVSFIKVNNNWYGWGLRGVQNVGGYASDTLGLNTTSAIIRGPHTISPPIGGRTFSTIGISTNRVVAVEASTGNAYGWGTVNTGDGTSNARSSPISVQGGRSFIKVAAGTQHSLAIEGSTGNAYGWGNNASGPVGDGSTTARNSPVSVLGGRSFSLLGAALGTSFAIEASTGLLWSWGANTQGVAGTNSAAIVSSSSPVSVVGGRSFVRVSGGGIHTVALASRNTAAAIEGSTGNAYCWGSGNIGQLGDNANNPAASSPVSVVGGKSFVEISVGTVHTAAIEGSTGNAYCWGTFQSAAFEGSAGDGTVSVARSSPVQVLGNRSFSKISAGNFSTLAVEASTGKLFGWGASAALGFDYFPSVSFPSRIPVKIKQSLYTPVFDPTSYAVGGITGAIEASTGRAYAWGPSFVGSNDSVNHQSPASIAGGRSCSQIVCGYGGTSNVTGCGIILEASTGFAFAWSDQSGTVTGFNGDNTATVRSSPNSVLGGRSYRYIACAGATNTYAGGIVGNTGAIFMWGSNNSGNAGDNSQTNRSSPVSVLGGRSWATFGCGNISNVGAIEASTGNAYCWGSSSAAGAMGDGADSARSSPVSVQGGRSFSFIAVGAANVAAIEGSTGNAWSWGDGTNGSNGDGSNVNRSSPVSVLGGRSYTQLAKAGSSTNDTSTIAIEGSTGNLYGWGSGTHSALGLDSNTSRTSPVLISARSFKYIVGACQVSLATTFLAVDHNDDVYMWSASNSGGTFGNNGAVTSPVEIRQIPSF